MSETMIHAALELASLGWSVLPCRWEGARGKSPLTGHGHHDASRDPVTIKRWWSRWPLAMIGATVPESLVVFDVDPRNGGSRTALEGALGPLPSTLTTWSGRGDGGHHLYFLRPGGGLSPSRLPEGIDLKINGYCILPPSAHPATGAPYGWDGTVAARLPESAIAALRPPLPTRRSVTGSGRGGDISALAVWVAQRPEGSRNQGLFWAACQALAEGNICLEALSAAAISAGLDRGEATATIRSAFRTAGVTQ